MLHVKWDTTLLSPSQYQIADYIQKHTQQVLLSTEQDIADAVQVSIASVSRFWKVVGYQNFKDFKQKMRAQLEVSPAGKMESIMGRGEGEELQHHILDLSVTHLYKTMQQFSSQSFRQAVNFLTESKRVRIYCPGPSEGLGSLLQYRLGRFGLDIRVMEKSGSELFEELIHLEKEAVVVLFGFVRLLPEARVILDYAKRIGYKTIIITDQLIAEFSTQANCVLFASRGEIREFHSMVAPTFLIENLIIAVGMENKEKNLKSLEMLSEVRKRYGKELPR
ncbi:MurR/RpiR family transcriptional regulator [Radiobacillus kanasensis]|uniref:MurR/RpiR family transcriptional regulator n=1 Tax=Radiobacillus kanasensis TaxID=2844358 RepID=UPI001E580A7B|nr:MurR/RpiR family transcriptional regulator [Radiobacillus kanasensis]UFT99628.1 MurR/RpiR family transcriptional regulator [Radiobacillus kanasensis]